MNPGILRSVILLTSLLTEAGWAAGQQDAQTRAIPAAPPCILQKSDAGACLPGSRVPPGLGDQVTHDRTLFAGLEPWIEPPLQTATQSPRENSVETSTTRNFQPALVVGLPAAPCQMNASTLTGGDMCCQPSGKTFQRFMGTVAFHPLTPRDKLLLAGKNTIDPFNLLTILGTSAISIGSDSDTAYGPGMKGFARNSGVIFTEGLTSEFFGTFLIPSLAGQDPHFHRVPNASTRRRVAHAFYQVVWTQSDTGKPMFNYATVFGTIADDAINDLYVPRRKLGAGASAARITTAIATVPIDNLITEFVPDLARRLKFHVVFLQRIINRVALEEGRNASD